MPQVIKYRTRSNNEDPWSPWREYSKMDIYLPRGTYLEMMIDKVLREGTRLEGRFGVTYTVLDGVRFAECFLGSEEEQIACKITHDNGDFTFAFIAAKDLNSMKELN